MESEKSELPVNVKKCRNMSELYHYRYAMYESVVEVGSFLLFESHTEERLSWPVDGDRVLDFADLPDSPRCGSRRKAVHVGDAAASRDHCGR